MIIGALFILAGILIAIYPPLLALFVAFILIAVGAVICAVNYHFKKIEKTFDDPFMNFFIKY